MNQMVIISILSINELMVYVMISCDDGTLCRDAGMPEGSCD
jgi:hypothetical protein